MAARPRRRRRILAAAALLALSWAAWRWWDAPPEDPSTAGSLQGDLPAQRLRLGAFLLDWRPASSGAPARLAILDAADPERVLLSHPPGEALLAAAVGALEVRESHGSFELRDSVAAPACTQSVEAIVMLEGAEAPSAELRGHLGAAVSYALELRAVSPRRLDLRLSVDAPAPPDRLFLRLARDPEERFWGFGAQYTHLDMRGRRVLALAQEQGIGRGREPLTTALDWAAGAGGDALTSYAPMPLTVTSASRGLALRHSEPSQWDLEADGRLVIKLIGEPGLTLEASLLAASAPAQVVSEATSLTGRMPALPGWIHEGAIIGMQGGSRAVRATRDRLAERGTPVAGYWLQDWVGKRKTSIGWQLWWNWDVDRSSYPDWEDLVAELRAQGARTLCYLNPFLVELPPEVTGRRRLYEEAEAQGFLVLDGEGRVAQVPITSFSAAMVDLTNPEARAWLAGVIEAQALSTGVSGWMADFGEALPFEASLHEGSGLTQHNAYPVAWARLNRELIDAEGPGELLAFHRSGYLESPRHATLFWLGDQLCSWDAQDGLATALRGLLSSGLCGMSYNHSDIGGYTSVGIPGMTFRRSPELLSRWMELNAFTAVFRTHEGNEPQANLQFDDSAALLSQFDRCARIYKALGPYRRSLDADVAERGWPLVRPLWFHDPADPALLDVDDAFLLGADVLVAPVLEPEQRRRATRLPAGRWVHLWSGEAFEGAAEVAAPLGEPPVFIRAESPWREGLRARLREMGVLDASGGG